MRYSTPINPRHGATGSRVEKNLSILATKLKSEWKNIYRRLSAYCLEQDGKVALSAFKKVTSESEVFLSSEDIRILTRAFSCEGGIDFEALSRSLGLNNNKIASINTQKSRRGRLQKSIDSYCQ